MHLFSSRLAPNAMASSERGAQPSAEYSASSASSLSSMVSVRISATFAKSRDKLSCRWRGVESLNPVEGIHALAKSSIRSRFVAQLPIRIYSPSTDYIPNASAQRNTCMDRFGRKKESLGTADPHRPRRPSMKRASRPWTIFRSLGLARQLG